MKIENNYESFIESNNEFFSDENRAEAFEILRQLLNKERRPFSSSDSKPIYFIADMH